MEFSSVFPCMQISLRPETAKGSEGEISNVHNCPGAHLEEFTSTTQAKQRNAWSTGETGACGKQTCEKPVCTAEFVRQCIWVYLQHIRWRRGCWNLKVSLLGAFPSGFHWSRVTVDALPTSCTDTSKFTEIQLHLKLHSLQCLSSFW